MHILLIHSFIDGNMNCSQFWTIKNNDSMNVLNTCLWDVFSFLLGKFIVVKLLGHRVNIYSTF